jgi:hypothetical protein
MKKLLVFALAAFAFAACKKDGGESTPPSYAIEFADEVGVAKDGDGNVITAAQAGVTVTIEAPATQGDDAFNSWSYSEVDGFVAPLDLANDMAASTTFKMPAGKVKMVANYHPTYPLTLVVKEGETTLGNDQTFVGFDLAGRVMANKTVTMEYEDRTAQGYSFGAPVSNNPELQFTPVEGENAYTFVMPEAALEVTVTYTAIPYTVTVAEGTADVETATVGQTVTLTYTGSVPSGKVFAGWANAEGAAGQVAEFVAGEGVYTFVMPVGNVSVVPVLANAFVLNFPAGAAVTANGAEVAASGDEVPEGAAMVVTMVTPQPGRELLSMTSEQATLTKDPNDANVYTFTMPGSETTVVANWKTLMEAPYLLYVDADGMLSVGKWGAANQSNLAYVKYGSLVVNKWVAGNWNTSLISYNPTTLAPTSWANVPYVGNTAIPAELNPTPGVTPYNSIDIPSRLATADGPKWATWAAYREDRGGFWKAGELVPHTAESIAFGKGDICKLVGLTAEEARALFTAGTLHEYTTSGTAFRMLQGSDLGVNYGTAYTGLVAVELEGMKGMAKEGQEEDLSTFLPKAGMFGQNGAPVDVQWGNLAGYWLADMMSDPTGWVGGYMSPNAGSWKAGRDLASAQTFHSDNPDAGLPVRCVPVE